MVSQFMRAITMFYVFFLFFLILIGIMLYIYERHVEPDKKTPFELLTCYYTPNITCNFPLCTEIIKIVLSICFLSQLPAYKNNVFSPHPERSSKISVQCHTHLHTDLLIVHVQQIQKVLGKNSLFLDKYFSKNHD